MKYRGYGIRWRERFTWSPREGEHQDQSEWQVVGDRGKVLWRCDLEEQARAWVDHTVNASGDPR